jgi:predicted ATPase
MIQAASRHVQVVIATQSVSMVDRFEPDDIVIVERTNHRSTFRRLQEADLSEWLESYTLSELWEKNVVGGRP